MNEEIQNEVKEDKNEVKEDKNDYKELYGKLRNQINTSREGYRTSLMKTKETIETFRTQLEILELKQRRLEGAIEASDVLLKVALPSHK